MVTKFISIKAVISKIVTDLNLGEYEIPYQNFIEWIVTGLKQIGVDYQFIQKEETIQIENYQGELPCDFYLFHRLLYMNDYLNHNMSLTVDDKQNTANRFTNRDYKIENNRIITSFKKGEVKLQYKAIPSDEDGLPMIPDMVEYETALFWRVVYQLLIFGHEFKNQYMNDLPFVQQQWRDYCAQASGAGNMPDLESLERMKNNWLRLYDPKNSFDKKFSDSGLKEHRRY